MCLARGDMISEHIAAKGRWRDCGLHVRLWQGLDGGLNLPRASHGAGLKLNWLPLPVAGRDPEGVLLEVGANIGACTVELLLRTRAKIVALEPSPVNLFYLTRNLKLLARRYPMVARRVVVLPVGAGVQSRTGTIVIDPTNLGDSVVASRRARVS